MLIRTKDNKHYQVLQVGPWQGLQEVKVDEVETPVNRWTGPKRTLEQHRQVLSFFAWTNREFKDEAMVHWFLNEEQGLWEPMVLPQRGVGMTVKVLEDHELYVPTFQRLGRGWEIKGTDHHHCSGSAFQSSVDHSDEKGKEGLHITIGNLGATKYSIHARSSFRQTLRPVFLTDWYEVPEALHSLPLDIQEQALEHLLCVPSDVEFPAWWKENVIKQQRQVVVYDTSKRSTGVTSQWGGTPYTSNRLKNELEDYCKEMGWTMWDLHEFLEALKENKELINLLDSLKWCYSDIDDACEWVEKALKSGEYDGDDENVLVDSNGEPILDKDGNFIPDKCEAMLDETGKGLFADDYEGPWGY